MIRNRYKLPFGQWTDEELVEECKLLEKVCNSPCFGAKDLRNHFAVLKNMLERGLVKEGHILPKRQRLSRANRK